MIIFCQKQVKYNNYFVFNFALRNSSKFRFSFILLLIASLTLFLSPIGSVAAETIDKSSLVYEISGGSVKSLQVDEVFSSLIITLDANDDGVLTITLPRDFMDSKIGDADDDFFVLLDGEEVFVDEKIAANERTLEIPFTMGTIDIEIIGTKINTSALADITAPSQPPDVSLPQAPQVPTPDEVGGGCLIATATFGTELAPQIQMLREVRDNVLLQTESGSSFMHTFNQFYYSFSPTVADWQRVNPIFKETVKITITPLITSLSILNYVEINSEAEMLGYGISLILLNAAMYFIAPALIVHRILKFQLSKIN